MYRLHFTVSNYGIELPYRIAVSHSCVDAGGERGGTIVTYAFVQDVPANEEIYREIRSALGDHAPAGLIVHVALVREGGLRYVDVWQSKADWEAFRDDHLEPVVSTVLAKYGVPHDHSDIRVEELDPIDAWIGAATPVTSA
jgi:hypothetical protein